MAARTTSSHPLPIVIVGAGIGGLSAAIHLAARGQRVEIFEQQPQVGGKIAQVLADGFRWDTGPSVITMRHVFAELFAAAGKRLEDYLELLPLEPLTRYFYTDGTIFDASRNWPQMAAAIEQLDPRDVAGYQRFLAFAADLHRITGPVFIYNQPPTPTAFLRVPLADMARVAPWSTLDRTIAHHIHSPHLRQLLGRFATYVGASPYHAPATLGVIAHVELTGGVWYPRGGVYRIAEAMQQVAQELGVVIHTSCPTAEILAEGGRATGIRLTTGERVAAQAVIANVDVTTVYRHLLPLGTVPAKAIQRLSGQEPSCSGVVLLLGVRRRHAELAHHNIFFPRNYRQEFTDIFQRGIPPNDPTIYVAISAKSDPDHAPAGNENWFVLVNAPALNDSYDWSRHAHAYRDHVLQTLAQRGYDIRADITVEQILTPADIARNTGAWRGALYGISSNSALNAFRRPHNRSPHLRNLYFAGGTTHPGGGVPMVTLSGRVAAQMVASDLAIV